MITKTVSEIQHYFLAGYFTYEFILIPESTLAQHSKTIVLEIAFSMDQIF